MQIAYLWSIALQTGQPAGTEAYLAHAAVGIFAVVLCSLSLYAWSRRRNVGLLLVSAAFLLFTLKEVIWVLSQMYNYNSSIDLIRALLDLVVLGLFFAAITLRPRKQLE
jgi:uncharacterized iron-regulated membrane protein